MIKKTIKTSETSQNTRFSPSILLNKKFAHRGLYGLFQSNQQKIYVPENSLNAFSLAIKNNFAIELDIHLLADQKIIVFHDNNTKRLTNTSIKLKKSTFSEIQNLTLRSTKTEHQEHIPTLSQVFELVADRTPLLIELKSEFNVNYQLFCKKCAQLISSYQKKYPQAQVAIKSFDPRIVHWFKKNTSITAGLLITSHPKPLTYFGLAFLHFPLNHWLVPDFLSVDKKIIQKKSIQKFRKSHPVLCWIVKLQTKQHYQKYSDNQIFEQ